MRPQREKKLRAMLEAKLAEATAALESKRQALRARPDAHSLDAEEEASATHDETVQTNLIQLHADQCRGLEQAFKRLKAKTYGICVDCRDEIDFKRLEAVPFTQRCRGCQEETEAPAYTRTRPFPGIPYEPTR